jgi:hypothetical protein
MVLCLCAAGIAGAHAADRDFEAIVRRLEQQVGAKRTHIPMMGMANFFVKMSRPEGVSDMKLAVFEDIDTSRLVDDESIDRVFDALSNEGWRPFVRVRSNKDRERVVIYSRAAGKQWELLLTTVEPNEATVIKMKLSPQALLQWIDDPDGMAKKKQGN